MNTTTPRIFIAATRQNDGKTTASLGLIAALQKHYSRVGYIKPVGQRFVQVEENNIDEDTVLMDSVFHLNCPLVDMSPIAVEPDFTRKYLQSSNNETLVKTIQKAFDRVYGAEPSVDQLEMWDICREMSFRIAWKPYMYSQTLPHLLGAVSAPALIVWGDDDKVVPQSAAKRYLEALTRAKLEIVKSCGHCVDMEQPETLARLVTDFIGRE